MLFWYIEFINHHDPNFLVYNTYLVTLSFLVRGSVCSYDHAIITLSELFISILCRTSRETDIWKSPGWPLIRTLFRPGNRHVD
jgi:hypothetical protein